MGRRRQGPNRIAEEEMPSSDDPRWEVWGAEVESYLDDNPMTSKELLHALPNYSLALVVNVISWLSLHERIAREGQKPSRWRKAIKPKVLPPPVRCTRCGGPWTQSMTGMICLYCGRPKVSPEDISGSDRPNSDEEVFDESESESAGWINDED